MNINYIDFFCHQFIPFSCIFPLFSIKYLIFNTICRKVRLFLQLIFYNFVKQLNNILFKKYAYENKKFTIDVTDFCGCSIM